MPNDSSFLYFYSYVTEKFISVVLSRYGMIRDVQFYAHLFFHVDTLLVIALNTVACYTFPWSLLLVLDVVGFRLLLAFHTKY